MPNLPDPNFYHQLGNQDQRRCLDLLREGRGAGAILSPWNFRHEGLLTDYASQYKQTNTELLIDPQFYTSDAARKHLGDEELDGTGAWVEKSVGDPLIRSSMEKQLSLACSKYLIPSPFAPTLTDSWLNIQRNFVDEATRWRSELGIASTAYATLPISVNIVTDDELRMKLLNSVSGLSVDGFYLITDIPVRPGDPRMLTGLMDIIFRLKRNGHQVLLGYTEPWSIIMFPFGLDSFASSALKNRRSFQHGQFSRGRRSGGHPPTFYNFWSPIILDSIRFPDEAEALQGVGLWSRVYDTSPFADRLNNASPRRLFIEKGMTQTDVHNNYSVMMCEIAKRFRNSDHDERIEIVREWISSARAFRDQMTRRGVVLRDTPPPYDVWSQALEYYLSTMKDDLEDEFG